MSVINMRTQDVDPIVLTEYRIESFKYAIDKKKAEIEHLEDTKRGLVAKLAEEKLYLTQLKGELRELKKEAKFSGQ